MADGVSQIAEDQETSATTPETVVETILGAKEFRGAVEHKDAFAPELKPAPEGVPEQFWDPLKGEMRTDALLKSYSELRKRMDGKSEDEVVEADEVKADEVKADEVKADEVADDEVKDDEVKDDEVKEVVETPEFAAATEAAAAVYAEKGELPEEARAPLKKLGVTDQQIDFYLQGIKATEASLTTAAHKAAGSADAYNAAVEWAAKGGLTAKQIAAFNTQTGDVELIGPAVAGLMASFKAANPVELGEGQLVNINGRTNHGDVYEHMDEFQQDLSKADQLRDPVARRKAVDKLRRSREAGTVTSQRRSPFGG